MRSYLISIWSFLDPVYYHFTRLTYVAYEESTQNIFRIRLTKYKGRKIVLSDGTEIQKNDILVKIHLHNVRLLKELKDIESELKKAKIIYRYVQKSLSGVEFYIQDHYCSEKIKGIVGITLLHKGCERLGFEVVDITHPMYRLFKFVSFFPIALLSQQNMSLKNIFMKQAPKYLFMSKNRLSTLYKNSIR
ncbi:hypothetical protein KHA93_07985 [Bacillus sp. FJAT-49732]|uniref:YkoP-like domain-containing protein n=1 Tax=Lederbergia citrisecunda TaxID=2833583 RepID=A0A942YKF4_9BACI|nr:hypothetical protein [Lederbergia citrisecunda]MBS4199592.1 hypothetical protein [Lederbergia citrisecunda]